LEASKAFAKDFMQKYGVKTAKYKTFQGPMLAIEYLKTQDFPIVEKASGLAAGKGVIICRDLRKLEKRFWKSWKTKLLVMQVLILTEFQLTSCQTVKP